MTESKDKKKDPDLYKKAVKGGGWVFAIRVITQLLSIGRYILIMNILEVKDMGLLGIAFLMIQTLNTFSNTGFNVALIQKKNDARSYLNTVWTVGIIRAFVLFAILYFAAPIFVNLKNIPSQEASLTISVIRVLGMSFFIGALNNIGVIYFKKDLQFHKQFVFQILPNLIGIAVSVILVFVFENVWSLVLGRMSANIFRCIISYATHPFRPKFKLQVEKAKELWGFGKWVFGATIVSFLLTQGDDFFVWIYLDATALALYQAAYKFSNIPATEISHVISQVSFPAYSKIQNDIPRTRDAYFKIFQFSSCLSIPVAALIFILTPEFVTIFLKPEWYPMIPVMQMLAIFGMLRSLAATAGPVYQAVGRPDIVTKSSFVKLVFLAIIIYPLTQRWGIVGTCGAILIAEIMIRPTVLYLLTKLLKCGLLRFVRIVSFPLTATILMLSFLMLIKKLWPMPNIGGLIILALGGLAVYIMALVLLDCFFGYGIIKIIKEIMAAIAIPRSLKLNRK